MKNQPSLMGLLPNSRPNSSGWPWSIEVDSKKYNKFTYLPKISVIIPSFNQGNFLEETIRSILLQNYPNLELIIIDGGSTDDSVAIIKKYGKWIHYWKSEVDKGQTNAVNIGFQLASGDLVGWQNSDDIYLFEAFYTILKATEAKPNFDIYFGNMIAINAESIPIRSHYYAPFMQKEMLFSGQQITNQSTFFSKKIVKSTFLDESLRYAMDGAFYLSIYLKTHKFYHIKSFLGCFRIHEMSKTSSIDDTIGWDEWVRIRRTYGIEMRSKLSWKKRYPLWRFWFKCRKLGYYFPRFLPLWKRETFS